MKINKRKMLALGASALAIGVSAPAFAGQTILPGVSQVDSAIPFGDVQGTLEIGNIGEVGQYDIDLNEADSIGVSILDDVDEGRIEQRLYATALRAGDATGVITNSEDGYAEVAAVAVGTGHGGGSGRAESYSAFLQAAIANNNASVTLNNDGELAASAYAGAGADSYVSGSSTYYGDASAIARQVYAIDQYAGGFMGASDETASVNLQNSVTGGITVSSVAEAYSLGEDAGADSYIYAAINQQANSDIASVELGNAGEITIGGLAYAEGDDYASATQRIYAAIQQVAEGATEATVALNNSGSAEIIGEAWASAYGATADANVGGIYQHGSATAADGHASVSLDNDGTLSVGALANSDGVYSSSWSTVAGIYQEVDGDNGAVVSITADNTADLNVFASATASAWVDGRADAFLSFGLNQDAYTVGAEASVTLTNSGEFIGLAFASADAGEDAYAEATAQNVLAQFASADDADGVASATITNDGTISIGATASAYASDTATLRAKVNDGIDQAANGGAGATVALTNNGTIEATAVGFASTGDLANADARVYSAIDQYAYAWEGGAAKGTLTNAAEGLISISATATASASATANANVYMDHVIRQGIYAADGGNADALIDNSGVVEVSAKANGVADNGYAYVDLKKAIEQSAYATNDSESSGNASVTLTNSATGSISLHASAVATSLEVAGYTSDASAYAYQAIYQYAGSDDGAASAAVTNEGSIDIGVSAFADGASADDNARAWAYLDNAVYQGVYAAGGLTEDGAPLSASATLDNTGEIDISAAASALGYYDAYGYAKVENGVSQYADGRNGSDAILDLTNDAAGTISISAAVSAVGNDTSSNYAYAYVEHAVVQGADTYEGGAASASLVNSGAVSVSAEMFASGTGYASASGSVEDFAIGQFANARGGGDATVVMGNTGSIDVNASAEAHGDVAYARAYAENAVYQGAYANSSGEDASGAATATLTNSDDGIISLQAAALAVASTGDASATGSAWGGVWQSANSANGAATADLVNDGQIDISAVATATASSGVGYAHAKLNYGVGNSAYANDGGDATASLVNNGSMNIGVAANAVGANTAPATAELYYAVGQFVGAGDGGAAIAEITNTASVLVTADATASGSYGTARAYADYAIYQSASATGSPTASGAGASGNATSLLTNASDGVISITANANAVGNRTGEDTDGYYASYAVGRVKGAYQWAGSDQGDASNVVTNDGLFEIAVTANSTPVEQDAYAEVDAYGIEQEVGSYGETGLASNLFTNVDDLTVDADATAAGQVNYATAYGTAHYAIRQQANAYGEDGTAQNTLDNSGSVTVNANAAASLTAEDGYGYAYASAVGSLAEQRADGETALSEITNSGALNLNVTADAAGVDQGEAYAWNYAIFQDAFGGSAATASVDNQKTGAINSLAQATAAGVDATATASAWAIDQTSWGDNTVMSVTNAGTINTDAVAKAVASSNAAANAYVGNLYQDSNYDSSYVLTNSGTMTADALADATGSSAYASGSAWNYVVRGHDYAAADLTFTNSGTMSAKAKVNSDGTAYANVGSFWVDAGSISGTVSNSSKITVDAEVNGSSESAYAYGIGLNSLSNDATITNSGTIKVSAKGTSEDAYLAAYGIYVTGATDLGAGSFSTADVDPVLTINNTGSIIARVSTDNGATWQHGTAITTVYAPNAAVINLKGGSVYGNIELSDDDVINVSTAVTSFDGQVNSGGDLVGTLNILAGGTLYLQDEPTANTSYDGAALVNVDDLNIDGTLALQLPSLPSGAGSYPKIVTNTADISGATLQIRPSSSTGLYANSYTFDNIIDADDLTGTFGTVTTLSGTPLLRFTATYDANDNVDLSMTRVAFGAVAGLSANQSEAGNGLESVYSPTMAAGPFASLLSSLFTMNTANYTSALDQLHGSQYASYLQSLTSVSGRFNTLLGDAAECAASEVTKACRAESGGIWGKISYGRTTKDGDVNAPAYKSNDWFMALGADFKASDDVVLGVAGAYVKNDLKFDRYAGRIKADGFQVGGYAAYDPGQFFVKAAVSYSGLNGDAQRTIAIPSVVSGTLTAEPDANAWTVSGQAGYRLPLGKASVLTPYAGIEHTAAKLKAFDEAGVAVANLAVEESDHNRTASLAGVKWTGTFGKIVPQIDLGWRHQFGDLTASVLQSYKIAAGSDFTAISQTEKADTALVGVSLGGEIGKGISVRVGYQGRFNGDVESHAGGITLTAKLGGGN